MTTEPNHTPTPWAVYDATPGFRAPCANDAADKAIAAADMTCVGIVWDTLDIEKTRANADFIVRAVNQYEALVEVAIAAGGLLLAKNRDNAEKLYAALIQLSEARGEI